MNERKQLLERQARAGLRPPSGMPPTNSAVGAFGELFGQFGGPRRYPPIRVQPPATMPFGSMFSPPATGGPSRDQMISMFLSMFGPGRPTHQFGMPYGDPQPPIRTGMIPGGYR